MTLSSIAALMDRKQSKGSELMHTADGEFSSKTDVLCLSVPN